MSYESLILGPVIVAILGMILAQLHAINAKIEKNKSKD